jgi:hypothetical protein
VSGTVASKKEATKKSTKSAEPGEAAGMVDPMQWWGALTQQFGQIAAGAMKDAAKQTAIDVTKGVAKDFAKGAAKGVAKSAVKKVTPKKRTR